MLLFLTCSVTCCFSGTEPWPFYFINGVLNFNVVFALALFSLPLTALMETLLHRFNVQNLGRPYWLTLSPMYLWMLVFFTRPHKEERFLFPIYPLICLCGAVALSSLQVELLCGVNYLTFVSSWFTFCFPQKCYHFLFQRYRLEHYTVSSNWLALSAVAVFTVLSLSRSVALFRGLHAHFTISSSITAAENTNRMCLQATTLLWTFTRSFTASPKTPPCTRFLKAGRSVCVLAKSGTASQAASFCRTSQYAGTLKLFLLYWSVFCMWNYFLKEIKLETLIVIKHQQGCDLYRTFSKCFY